MKKLISLLIASIILFNIAFAIAHEEEIFLEAENIIKQKIPCENINEEDLEILGDYFMEQMHPGELHEIMDQRMGGEGSESLKQVHINMGKMFYCGNRSAMPMNMMNMMMGRNYYYGTSNYLIPTLITSFLVIIILILLIVWFIKQLQKK